MGITILKRFKLGTLTLIAAQGDSGGNDIIKIDEIQKISRKNC